MSKISPDLEQQLKEKSHETFDLIVRTDGDATPHLAWCVANDLHVKRQYRLSPGLAISGRGEDALKLADMAWVISIELDAPVTAM